MFEGMRVALTVLGWPLVPTKIYNSPIPTRPFSPILRVGLKPVNVIWYMISFNQQL